LRDQMGFAGRRSNRVCVDLPATLIGRTRHEVRLVDLSLTGCLVRGKARLDEGTIVDLELGLGGQLVCVKVRVAAGYIDGTTLECGATGFLAGLTFLDLSTAEQAALRAFLERERRRSADTATR
jgi:hypothetical protein